MVCKKLDQLLLLASEWRIAKLSVGFTCGAFDILHAGHVDYLQRARALCDRLIVAVNTDRSIRSYKDPLRPVNPEAHRVAVVSALACVDVAILMDDLRPEFLISSLKPDFYIKGGDYQIQQLRSAPLMHSYGGKCLVIPVTHEVSTTQMIRRIQALAAYAKPDEASANSGKPIIFLDRDGTIIQNIPFVNSPLRVQLLPGVGEGLRALQDKGFLLVVVTNQQGIGLGYFDYDEFVSVNSQMLKLLSEYGVQISRFYFCPHSLSDSCSCRKPGTKLIEDALAYFGSQAADCFLIGDSPSDVSCAERSGCNAILLSQNTQSDAGFTAASFSEAVNHIFHSTSSPVAAL
jgi:rfaE bifunctional protein nucleotidyltransferase chain/domain